MATNVNQVARLLKASTVESALAICLACGVTVVTPVALIVYSIINSARALVGLPASGSFSIRVREIPNLLSKYCESIWTEFSQPKAHGVFELIVHWLLFFALGGVAVRLAAERIGIAICMRRLKNEARMYAIHHSMILSWRESTLRYFVAIVLASVFYFIAQANFVRPDLHLPGALWLSFCGVSLFVVSLFASLIKTINMHQRISWCRCGYALWSMNTCPECGMSKNVDHNVTIQKDES